MGTHKLGSRRLHDALIQMPGIEPGPVHIEGILQPGIVDLIGIFLADAGADGIEVLIHLKGLRHHDIAGQMGIQGIGEPLHRDGRGGPEIRHIAPGVDPRVCAAAAGDVDAVAHHLGGSLFHGLCHRGQILLDLPAVVAGAEIGQKQGNVPHTVLTVPSPPVGAQGPPAGPWPHRPGNHCGRSAAASFWSVPRRPDSSGTPWQWPAHRPGGRR